MSNLLINLSNNKMISASQVDVLVIGAGPSGAIATAILQKKGYQVKVVEKTLFPRFVIGESLLPRCMDHLEEAGLLDVVKQYGFQEKFGAKFIYKNKSCDFNFSEQYTKGWKWTWQVPRAEFDQLLIDTVAAREGVSLSYETTVIDVKFEEDKVFTTIVDKEENQDVIESKYIIDGSGYGRVLPNLLGLNQDSSMPSRAAFFTHINDDNRPNNLDGNRIQAVVLKQDVWCWIIPFSNGKTSVGFVGDLSFENNEASAEEKFNELIAQDEYLTERLKGVSFDFEPKEIVGYSASVSKLYGERFVLTGNSTEFLDPIFSSGVTFAMETGIVAAKLIVKELEGEKVDWEQDFSKYILQGVDVFRSYVNAWYEGTLPKIFFADEINQDIKTKICSVLAGYVWDHTNPYVKKHNKALKVLANVVSL